MTTNSLRPGVFSSYTVTSSAISGVSAQYAAVCACAIGGEKGKLYRFKSFSEVSGIFTGGAMLAAAKLLLENGVSELICVPVSVTATAATENDYKLAFAATAEIQNIGVLLCDSTDTAVQKALLASINASCTALKERIAVIGAGATQGAEALAQALNSERICICAPACTYEKTTDTFMTACGFAALLLASPADENLSGSVCRAVTPSGENLSESTVQALLGAGVTVFEADGNNLECVKAVTTRTKTNGAIDTSFTNIATTRIIDEILQRARATMKLLLKTAKGGSATLQSMVAQMTVLLSAASEEGLLRSYDTPRAYPSATDPSVCVMELSFAVATAINQIHIVAHIQL
ncbi:MAG: hypothetical protein RSC64_00955 [Hydrogenoanaerobacterium sp.]